MIELDAGLLQRRRPPRPAERDPPGHARERQGHRVQVQVLRVRVGLQVRSKRWTSHRLRDDEWRSFPAASGRSGRPPRARSTTSGTASSTCSAPGTMRTTTMGATPGLRPRLGRLATRSRDDIVIQCVLSKIPSSLFDCLLDDKPNCACERKMQYALCISSPAFLPS